MHAQLLPKRQPRPVDPHGHPQPASAARRRRGEQGTPARACTRVRLSQGREGRGKSATAGPPGPEPPGRPPAAVGGAAPGDRRAPPSPPPPQARERTEADRRVSSPAPPRGGRCTQEKGGGAARPRQAPPVNRPHARALPATDRHSPPPSPPPTRRTDPLAADRAAPDAHGRQATPTARVYPGGMDGRPTPGRAGGRGAAEQPPLPPPRFPPGLRAAGAPAPHPPGAEGTPPHPPEGTASRLLPRGPRPIGGPAPACRSGARTTPGGGTRPRTGTVWGPRPPRPEHRATRKVAQSGRAEGGLGSEGAPRGAVQGPPIPPPPLARQAAPGARGGPTTPTERARRGEMHRRREGGRGREPRAAPQRGSRGAAARPRPPPPPPPPARKPRERRPPPPRGRGDGPPSPRQDRGARERGRSTAAPPPQLSAPTGTAGSTPTRANAPGRRTDHARRRQASTNRSGIGATPSMTRTTPVTPALLPPRGRQRDGTRQSDPTPHWPPHPYKRGARRTGRPPCPPTPPPAIGTPRRRRPTPRGAHNPSQIGENRDRAHPPQARQTEQGTGAGHADGHGPRGTALPAPSAGTARGAHATPPREGGEADTARARAHTHTKGTRGLPQGQPDRARGTHRPPGMAYQRARIRDTRPGRPATHRPGHAGREGGNGGDTTPGTSPSPPNRPRAPRTHGRGSAPAKAVVAHCATPQPQG